MADFFVHETSCVDEGAVIGSGTRIWHFCHIMPRAQIGAVCNIGQNVFIASDVIVGNNVKIQNNVSLYTGVKVEDDVFLGPSMVFTNVVNPRSHIPRRNQFLHTLIKKGATIGANATIVCGVTVGRFAFVGAGSLVARDVLNYGLVYGNPARLHGWMCQCGVKLGLNTSPSEESANCAQCGAQYLKKGREVVWVEG